MHESIFVCSILSASPLPNYARNTVSNQCRNESSEMKVQTPLPNIGDNYSDHLMSASDLSSNSGNLSASREKVSRNTVEITFI